MTNQFLYLRNDDHKETGGNQTYKINYSQVTENLKFALTHSTGLKNPSLYELYGSSNSMLGALELILKKVYKWIYFEYIFSDNLIFNSTFYRTNMTDRIKIKSDWSGYENKIPDTTQEGVESEIGLFFR